MLPRDHYSWKLARRLELAQYLYRDNGDGFFGVYKCCCYNDLLATKAWEIAVDKETSGDKSISYKDSGVDIERADSLVDFIKGLNRGKRRPGVLGGIGGFGALFELPWSDYREPVLVSGTDGVGTKLCLAIELEQHDTIGIDLVAMCVNDVIISGARPLFFLDYLATGKLRLEQAKEIVAGVHVGCEQADMALVGGETAEMPGMYRDQDYDLAGFCVGLVEKSQIIDGSSVVAGDVVLGLAANGVHANGFSLVRRVIEVAGLSLGEEVFAGQTLGEVLLQPTKIYVRAVRALLDVVKVGAMAHITGGGIADNLLRVLPAGVRVTIDVGSWQRPQIFDYLAARGPIDEADMRQTFNLGIGMMIVVPKAEVEQALRVLELAGESAWVVGSVAASSGAAEVVWGE